LNGVADIYQCDRGFPATLADLFASHEDPDDNDVVVSGDSQRLGQQSVELIDIVVTAIHASQLQEAVGYCPAADPFQSLGVLDNQQLPTLLFSLIDGGSGASFVIIPE
jgi:hypothetical protein